MVPLSEKLFADERVWGFDFPKWPMASPYAEYPFWLREAAADPEACRRATASLSEEAALPAALRGKEGVSRKIRETLLLPFEGEVAAIYEGALARYRSEIERFFSVALTTASRPQLLAYGPGGHYRCHADDSGEIRDAAGGLIGYRKSAPERKITTLLFLGTQGEDFTGGALRFCHLYDEAGEPVRLRPKAGMLLAFPSHPLFTHEVEPVVSGRRYAVAQWHDAIG
ncbi:2OG-Fe(II) oxygenase [Hydrogenimonas sp.]